MHDLPQVEVPVGIRAEQWSTIRPDRTVLVIAHNVTTITRLLDVLPVFDSDPRVQIVVSWNDTDPFQDGLRELVASLGIIAIPWMQARQTRFDLVISASHHGDLTDITGPLVILSHGIGYTKYSPGNRKSEIGNRKSEIGERQTFGLSPQWVLYDGAPFASALVLSHEEQLARLAAAAPAAAEIAVLAGDPCFDRLVASAPHRAGYRAALGSDDRCVVFVSSTWWRNSLLGSWPDLTRRLLAELPAEKYQVIAAMHPNIWHGHGRYQVRAWLGDSLRSGLVLLSEVDGWRPGLIAADVAIGDHGSVTGYAAAIGTPTLLAAFPDEDVAVGSPIAKLGELAPRLDRSAPLIDQVQAAITQFKPGQYAEVTSLVTSAPQQSLIKLREVFYGLMGLPEPPGEPPLLPLPAESLADTPPTRSTAMHVEYTVDTGAQSVELQRYPAEVQRGIDTREVDIHISCPADYPLRTLRARAAVLTGNLGEPETWFQDILDRYPSCAMAALLGEDSALIQLRDGTKIEAHGTPASALPSAVYAWLTTGKELPAQLSLNGKAIGLR